MSRTTDFPPDELLSAIVADTDQHLQRLGTRIGKLYTDHGLPIDMALDRVSLTRSQNLAVLFDAQSWLIEHRRNSNATEKAIDRQRNVNRTALLRFIATGESGVY